MTLPPAFTPASWELRWRARSTTSYGTATSSVKNADGTALIYIDRHLVHEVTSPQAYEGLKLAGRKTWRAQSVVATADHNTPTKDWDKGISDPISRTQVETLDANIKEHGAKAYFPFLDRRQGIVHVIGPEQGATLPGMTVVCGDSHTSTHGAFAALAFGIGTSEVEHVLATQCLVMKKAKSMLIRVDGRLRAGRDREGPRARRSSAGSAPRAAPATRSSSRGDAVRALSMEVAHDDVQHGDRGRRARRHGRGGRQDDRVIKGRPLAPTGEMWDRAVAHWRTLKSDEGARSTPRRVRRLRRCGRR